MARLSFTGHRIGESLRAAVAVAVLCLLVAPHAEAAGVQFIEVSTDQGTGKLKGAVWSPCAAPAEAIKLGRAEILGVKDCPVTGADLPLVVISHGARGWFAGHHDTAAALADAGYVVAAVTHSDEPGRRWHRGRPAAIKSLIDHMLGHWPERARLDRERIGFFGFSRGGYTGLVLIGARPDIRRIVRHCRLEPRDPICKLPGRSKTPKDETASAPAGPFAQDPRIKAAVIAAPVGIVFSPEELRKVTVPVQLWRLENDEILLHPYHAEAVYKALPVKPDYRVVPNAGHFAVLAPCNAAMGQAYPKLCRDGPGFDRIAFHKAFNAEILAFFDKHLKKP